MARAVVTLLVVAVTIYALVDCWRSAPDEVQRLSRPAWLVTILVVPLAGALLYLTLGRTDGPGVAPPRRRVVAPDDDPDFLLQLEIQRRRAQAEERRRAEAEQKSAQKAERAEQKAAEKRRRAEQREQHQADPAATGQGSDDAPDGDAS